MAQPSVRSSVSLNAAWRTIATTTDEIIDDFEKIFYDDKSWKQVEVPHNWDAYDGYRRLRHGNKHGTAWYRKKFRISFSKRSSQRYFLFFEGVGSYATVWLNGKQVGYHAGGRTTFTIDITNDVLFDGKQNILAVKAEHPSFIKDLPWVCGGCSDERGFSEGSQPMGIFRPVSLIITSNVRIEPFGTHVWNHNNVTKDSAQLYVSTEIKSYSVATRSVRIVQNLLDKNKMIVATHARTITIRQGEKLSVAQQLQVKKPVHLWEPANAYLYQLQTRIIENGKLTDELNTPYGIRSINWSSKDTNTTRQFFINGKPLFINGVAEYEHMFGNSHAFSKEQIKARAMQVKAAGFNAFRDAHQPHNLAYDHYWDSCGILWWTQFSAHVWYDSPEFRQQFKTLLMEWVKERRNSPSVVLWGLQNESKLPKDFAKECSDIIRSMDPTTSSQRLVTTCNGGEGTDWDVPQNWTGTYGGDPEKYAEDVKRQVLIGEYGAWRTIDLHSDGGFSQDSVLSEDRMTALMETKVRLAESAKDSAAGHFFWLMHSHDNPGRVQAGEGYRELDRIGPVNYKGLFTNWEEPVNAWYMYQSNYTSPVTNPMLYIASHNWPGRWLKPGIKSGIIVYSNCDEVELFNDVNGLSLGKQKRKGTGTHFEWNNVLVQYNVLYAKGYVNGREVVNDRIVLHYLDKAPHFSDLYENITDLLKPQTGYKYLYRVNCGGPDYKDTNGNYWLADRQQTDTTKWGSQSWTTSFSEMPPYFASQRQTYDPVAGTLDWPLFQQFRYGRNELRFSFPVPDGTYRVELYFIEPWLSKAGGVDARGWRLFDIAVNDSIQFKDVDLWKEAGHDKAVKKVCNAVVKNGQLKIHFPRVSAGQAVLSAIAIATKDANIQPAQPSPSIVTAKTTLSDEGSVRYMYWMNEAQKQFTDHDAMLVKLPPALYGAEWIQASRQPVKVQCIFNSDAELYIAYHGNIIPAWLKDFDNTRSLMVNSLSENFEVYKKRFKKGEQLMLENVPDAIYTVAVQHASNMQPAYDLKQLSTYKAEQAKMFSGGLQRQMINEKPMLVFMQNTRDTLEWEFETGVADIYSLAIRYNNPLEKEMKGTLRLLAADGTLLKREDISFTYTRPGKWNYINTNSGSMINAGKYKLQLIAADAQGLILNSLEVQ